MKGEMRRESILARLGDSDIPVSASSLSQAFGVSRQIIVKDIARLREMGAPITSHARGYILEKKTRPERVLKIIHSDEDVEKELNLIVDLGGAVEDVFIYHKFYNKVEARLDIRSRLDVQNFLENITSGKSSLLKNVTSGYHYHTISAESVAALDRIEEELGKCGFLAPLQEYEPEEMGQK